MFLYIVRLSMAIKNIKKMPVSTVMIARHIRYSKCNALKKRKNQMGETRVGSSSCAFVYATFASSVRPRFRSALPLLK